MFKIRKSRVRVENCLKYYGDKKRYRYKYFTEMRVYKNDIATYKKWLEECDRLGFEFCLFILKLDNECYCIYGFSNFKIASLKNTLAIDHPFKPEHDKEWVAGLFMGMVKNSKYFIFSGKRKDYKGKNLIRI